MKFCRDSGQWIRIVIRDAHAADRSGLTQLLSAQPDIELIGVTTDGEQALQMLRELRPNVQVMVLRN